MDGAELKSALLARARALGFDIAGVGTAETDQSWHERLERVIAEGGAGDMAWLARAPERRSSPRGLWNDVRTVVCLGVSYTPASDPLAVLDDREAGAISVYAQGRDYHDVIKSRLKALARWLVAETGCDLKLFVDTAPVMEKPLAQRAGLGWQGKHTNLVSRRFGSWLFLAELYLTIDLPPDEAQSDHCGSCHRCLDICPTDAFPGPYRLDPRRCISYLTIEHKGPIPREFRAAIGNRIYGCDDCLAVCPWNKFAQRTAEMAFEPRGALTAPRLAALVQLGDTAFRSLFSGSPIKRIGRDRFVRNVLIALGNTGNRSHATLAEALLDDASALVRSMAIWALSRLDPGRFRALAERRRHGESDASVRTEWDV